MSAPTVMALVDEGLGNSAYLVDLGERRALVVDASRDLRPVRTATEDQGLRVAYAADTHLHADFLSGARQLAHTDDATVLASAAGRRPFAHTGLADNDEVDLGGLGLRALTTPDQAVMPTLASCSENPDPPTRPPHERASSDRPPVPRQLREQLGETSAPSPVMRSSRARTRTAVPRIS